MPVQSSSGPSIKDALNTKNPPQRHIPIKTQCPQISGHEFRNLSCNSNTWLFGCQRVKFPLMPPTNEPVQQKSLQEVVTQLDLYPIEAFEFVREGLAYTVDKLHGKFEPDSTACRHVSGQQLCEG